MNRRILLIRPNHTQDKKNNYATFPSGLAYVASVLIKRDYTVNITDLTLEDVNYDNLAERVKRFNPDIIGISAMSFEYAQVRKLSSYLKKIIPCKIILGGPIVFNYDLILRKIDVDICVIGEGELTIVDLLENLSSLAEVKSIAYRDNGQIIRTAPRELIRDLDAIPFPAYELFDMDKYSRLLIKDAYISHKYLPKKKVHRKMSLEASRGCPFACDFCSKLFRTTRRRSADRVIEEIRYLKERYDIDVFGFYDELFFSNKDAVYEFCQKIRPLEVGWHAMFRVDTVDRESLEMLKKSGCLEITFGVESGSDKILKNMNKKTTSSQIEETLKNALEIGLLTDASFILGYLGEDKDSVQDTIDLLKRVGYPGIRFRYITAYPGSLLYDRCIENGLIENEEAYLESLGDGTGPYRCRINFTKFTDEELTALLPETTTKILRNYLIYLLKHPNYLFKYLTRKDFMNPVYYYYNRWFHPTNYDKASKKRRRSAHAKR